MLGWKYVNAEEDSQKYKVGKFILETKRVVKGVGWDEGAASTTTTHHDEAEEENGMVKVDAGEEEDIQFDSQDEEECEDLFSGVWSPQLARRRRKNRGFGRSA